MCVVALLWLDGVSRCDRIKNGVHVSLHQSLRTQNSARPFDSGIRNMVLMSTEVQFIKAVCAARKATCWIHKIKNQKDPS